MIEPGNVAAILLAAGGSRRFGSEDKLLARVRGEPVVQHAARAIAALGPARRIAVCRDARSALAMLLARHGFEIVENARTDEGLSRSLRLGVAEAEAGSAAAALVALADMPFVTTAHLARLLGRFDPAAAPVVASGREGVAMPPAIFARSRFAALARATGDAGGRALLADAAIVEAPADMLADIDRPADLRRG